MVKYTSKVRVLLLEPSIYKYHFLWYFCFMAEQESFEDQFPHMAAAMEATKDVQPGNELQEQAAADITRLAFEMEVRRAFPETAEPTSK